MQFEAMNEATLANAPVLNRAFLELALSGEAPAGIPRPFGPQFDALSATERERIARVPFLLFTLDHYDVRRWQRAASERPGLFDQTATTLEWRLATATLGVVWALVQSNRYAARYLTGASVAWCDDIAALPLPELIESMERLDTLIVPRFVDRPQFWNKLIASGRDARQLVRRAARFSALQCVLTAVADEGYTPVQNAACRRRDASLSVAEQSAARRREP